MNISVIIPTVGRELDLIKAIQSIERNSIKPFEILIIDQGDIKQGRFKNFSLNLKLIKINKKSSTQARNIGIELAKGDIISFLDDDIVLKKNYFEEVLESFIKYEKVKIVQGKIINYQSNKKIDFFWGLFLGPGSIKKTNYVRKHNFENIFYGSDSDSGEYCMWASGSNMNVRKEVFNYEKFDSKLIRYSSGEDVDFSFRVYKRFGINSILFQPKAQLVHKVIPSGRLTKYDFMLTRRVHKIYFVCKNNKNIKKVKTIENIFKQFWYLLGCMIINIYQLFKGNYKPLFYFFAIEYQIFLHRKDIRKLNIEWMNIKLFNEKSTPKAKIVGIYDISK